MPLGSRWADQDIDMTSHQPDKKVKTRCTCRHQCFGVGNSESFPIDRPKSVSIMWLQSAKLWTVHFTESWPDLVIWSLVTQAQNMLKMNVTQFCLGVAKTDLPFRYLRKTGRIRRYTYISAFHSNYVLKVDSPPPPLISWYNIDS